MKKLRVLHYVTGFSTLSETFIYDLITGLEKRKITENIVVCRKRTLEIERPFEKVFILKQKKPLKRLLYNIIDPKHMQMQEGDELLRLIEEVKPDIIHSHFAIAGIRLNNFLNKYNIQIPLIVSFHGSDVTTNPYDCKMYLKNLLNLNLRDGVKFTVPTNFLKQSCTALGLSEEKIIIQNNTINDFFIDRDQSVPWNGREKLKIVILGRLVPMKGHKYALEALKLLKKNFSNFQLDIWGSGHSLDELKSLVQQFNLNNQVNFKGSFQHQDLPEILLNYHLSITPSIKTLDNREESFCISLVEASLIGLYCLASNAGGPNEVLKENNDFKFKMKDPEAIKEKILEFIRNPEQRMKRALELKEFMLASYHPSIYFNNYSSIYEKLVRC